MTSKPVKKTAKTPEVIPEVAVTPEPEVIAKKEMTTIEKVQLMSSLASIATDETLATDLKSRHNGDIVYQVFIEAVEKKLKLIMDGQEEMPQQVTSLLSATGRIDVTLSEMQRMIMGFMETPLVQILSMMNQNLGGKKFEIDRPKIEAAEAAVAQAQKPRPQPNKQQPRQQQSQQQVENAQPVAYNSYTRSGAGGSF